jgi:hypothetical protein
VQKSQKTKPVSARKLPKFPVDLGKGYAANTVTMLSLEGPISLKNGLGFSG